MNFDSMCRKYITMCWMHVVIDEPIAIPSVYLDGVHVDYAFMRAFESLIEINHIGNFRKKVALEQAGATVSFLARGYCEQKRKC